MWSSPSRDRSSGKMAARRRQEGAPPRARCAAGTARHRQDGAQPPARRAQPAKTACSHRSRRAQPPRRRVLQLSGRRRAAPRPARVPRPVPRCDERNAAPEIHTYEQHWRGPIERQRASSAGDGRACEAQASEGVGRACKAQASEGVGRACEDQTSEEIKRVSACACRSDSCVGRASR